MERVLLWRPMVRPAVDRAFVAANIVGIPAVATTAIVVEPFLIAPRATVSLRYVIALSYARVERLHQCARALSVFLRHSMMILVAGKILLLRSVEVMRTRNAMEAWSKRSLFACPTAQASMIAIP
tara:strand:- start:116 stop:490 length:375 start_codon:yes stop_codon:yes gene_type:complete